MKKYKPHITLITQININDYGLFLLWQLLEKISQLRRMLSWILADFRSMRNVFPDIQDGWNHKGWISQNGEKKKAFYVLQNYYETKKAEYKKK